MRTRESTLWTWHLIAGGVILVLLGIHMFIMHLGDFFGTVQGDVLNFSSVMERSRDASFAVIYVLLLGAALYHGLYGLRTMIFELNISEKAERAVSALFVLGGLVLFVMGAYGTIMAYGTRTGI
jgi:succinate dehydrogenase / fumarate reductase membrane anchor subunit